MSDLKAERKVGTDKRIQVRQGDLTLEHTDAIVNAANSSLSHGGGLAGAIVRRGGMIIQEESHRWIREKGRVPTGQAAVTGPGSLPCRYVIHAVGPVWKGGGDNEDELLRQAVANSLVRADELGLAGIALPAVSSGIFGFPKDRCARIVIQTALEFFRDNPATTLREIRFVSLGDLTVSLLVRELENT